MWLEEAPAPTDDLRQGDLLTGLILPQLKLPISYIRLATAEPSPGDSVLLNTPKQTTEYLVVSQCCVIENNSVVALAPVENTGRLADESLAAHLNNEPIGGAGYVYTAQMLPPINGHLAVSNGLSPKAANFRKIQTYSGEISILQRSRVAAMSPAGRRILRIRLGLFWGRAEAEDEKWLEQNGLPSGLRPPPA